MRGKGPLVMLFKSDADGTEKGYKFTYKFELRGPDPCRSNPCKYGGKCKRMATYYVCNCPPGVGGQNCELDLDECSSMPCKNAGKCENGAARYSCVCDNGFKGTMCEIAPNRCEPNPCLNNGRCIGRLDDFACQCSDEYMGDVCDVPIPTFPQPTTTTTKATTTKTTTTIPTTTTTQGADDSLSGQPEYDDYEEEDDDEESDLLTYVAMTLIFLMLVAAAYYCLVVKKRQKEKPAHKINLNKVTKKEEEEDFSPKQTKKKRRRVMSEKNDVTRVSSVDEKSVKSSRRKTKYINKRKTKFKNSSCSQESVKSVKSRSRNRSDSPEITEIEIVDCEQPSPQSYKKMTIPLFPNELRSNNLAGNAQVSPEKAFEILNQLKMQSMLPPQQYPPMNQHAGYPNPMYNPRMTQQYNPSYFTPASHPLKGYEDVTEMAITANEAAQIINNQIAPYNHNNHQRMGMANNFVSPEDAAAMLRIIREQRNQRNSIQPMRREQTVLLRPHEVANMINAFRNSKLPESNDTKDMKKITETSNKNETYQKIKPQKNQEKSGSDNKNFKSPQQARRRPTITKKDQKNTKQTDQMSTNHVAPGLVTKREKAFVS